jgi:hypothetical protein
MAEAAGLVLLVWLAASVIGQFPGRWNEALRARDAFGLIPSWSFFAPNPARSDCHLVYRHVLDDGGVTEWTEAFVWRSTWTRAIWNPDRRVEKAISDANSHLARRKDVGGVHWSTPYLLLLNYVSGLPAPADAVAVQFALLGSFGYDADAAPFARFLSDAHPLEAPRAVSGATGVTDVSGVTGVTGSPVAVSQGV